MPRCMCSFLGLLTLLLLSLLLIEQSSGTHFTSYKSQTVEDRSKKEIMSLLNRIADILNNGYTRTHYLKRNGGTADTLYNLPDLMDIGRRR